MSPFRIGFTWNVPFVNAPAVQLELPGKEPEPPPTPLFASVVSSLHPPVQLPKGLLLRDELWPPSHRRSMWQSTKGKFSPSLSGKP